MSAIKRVAIQGVNLAALETVLGKLWLRKEPRTTGANTTCGHEKKDAVIRVTIQVHREPFECKGRQNLTDLPAAWT